MQANERGEKMTKQDNKYYVEVEKINWGRTVLVASITLMGLGGISASIFFLFDRLAFVLFINSVMVLSAGMFLFDYNFLIRKEKIKVKEVKQNE